MDVRLIIGRIDGAITYFGYGEEAVLEVHTYGSFGTFPATPATSIPTIVP